MPGNHKGKDLSVQDVFEAVGACAAGIIDDAELKEIEKAACPGAGACGGQFTANSMAMAMTFLGLSPMGANDVPAVSEDKNDSAFRAGQIVVDCVNENRLPRPRPTPSCTCLPSQPKQVCMILILTLLIRFPAPHL